MNGQLQYNRGLTEPRLPRSALVMSWAGVPVIYLAAAGLVAIALLLTWRLKKRPPVEVPEAISSS